MIRGRRFMNAARAALAGCLVAAALLSATGCVPKASGAGALGTRMAASGVQTCSSCAGKGVAPTVEGVVGAVKGAQMIPIGVKDGYYSPNRFTARAGTPVTVVFKGKASGCLGKPTFQSLGKSADFTRSGSATIKLGALKPGMYVFGCATGMAEGVIVVQ